MPNWTNGGGVVTWGVVVEMRGFEVVVGISTQKFWSITSVPWESSEFICIFKKFKHKNVFKLFYSHSKV